MITLQLSSTQGWKKREEMNPVPHRLFSLLFSSIVSRLVICISNENRPGDLVLLLLVFHPVRTASAVDFEHSATARMFATYLHFPAPFASAWRPLPLLLLALVLFLSFLFLLRAASAAKKGLDISSP